MGGTSEHSLVEIGRVLKLRPFKGSFSAKVALLKKGRAGKLGGRKIYFVGEHSPFEISLAYDAAVAAGKSTFKAGFKQGDTLLEVGANKMHRSQQNGAF